MHKHLLPITLLLGGALAGCGGSSSEYTFGERVRLRVERATDGESLLELSVGPARRECTHAKGATTKVDVELKGLSLAALLLTHRHNECRA